LIYLKYLFKKIFIREKLSANIIIIALEISKNVPIDLGMRSKTTTLGLHDCKHQLPFEYFASFYHTRFAYTAMRGIRKKR